MKEVLDKGYDHRSLLEAVNAASAAARTAWFGFLGLTAYLFIAIAGVSHADLLVNAPVILPLFQVKVSLAQFFFYAPIVFVFIHLGVLVQHVSLAQKVTLLDQMLQEYEQNSKKQHPDRFELYAYFMTQAIAGPSKGGFIARMLDIFTWISLAIIPVILLLSFQSAFLPFHDAGTTWAHRFTLLLDLFFILLTSFYLGAPLKKFWAAIWQNFFARGLRSLTLTLFLMSGLVFSFFIATIPDSPLDKLSQTIPWLNKPIHSGQRQANLATAWLFEGEVNPVSGRSTALLSRNLIVTDADLVKEDEGKNGEISISLRGRDLRYATLDRSDLHGADFTGAVLTAASMQGTRLEDTLFVGADLRQALFWREGQEDADFVPTRLARANFRRAALYGANFHNVTAAGANFAKAEIVGAVFLNSQMQGADFQHSNLIGANFTGANLTAARFTGAHIYGANFALARLVGADLRGAALVGVDFRGANVEGADLRQGMIWQSTLPQDSEYSDYSFRHLISPKNGGLVKVKDSFNRTSNNDLKIKLRAKLSHLLDAAYGERKADGLSVWAQHRDYKAWKKRLVNSVKITRKKPKQDPDVPFDQTTFRPKITLKEQISKRLAQLACDDLSTGNAIANGIARRGGETFLFQPIFNGDPQTLLKRLKRAGCKNGRAIKLENLRKISRAVQLVKSQKARAKFSPNRLGVPPGRN